MTEPPGTITFSYDPGTRVRTATYRGVITDASLLGAYEGLMSGPDYVPEHDSLVDLRSVTRFDVTAETLRVMIDRIAAQATGSRRPRTALVAPTDVAYGLARMYELLSGPDAPRHYQVFRDMDDALRWLGSGPS